MHKDSACHKQALQLIVVLPACCPNVGKMLSKEHADWKKDSRQCLLRVLSNIRFLTQQGIALRDNGDENDFNFIFNSGSV